MKLLNFKSAMILLAIVFRNIVNELIVQENGERKEMRLSQDHVVRLQRLFESTIGSAPSCIQNELAASVLTGNDCVLSAPPGTGKSFLIQALSKLM